MREVAVSLIRAGHCVHPQRATIRDGSWRPTIFPALSVLLVHPVEGPILFDTGYDPAFFAATGPFPERFYRWLTPATLPPGADVRQPIAAACALHPTISATLSCPISMPTISLQDARLSEGSDPLRTRRARRDMLEQRIEGAARRRVAGSAPGRHRGACSLFEEAPRVPLPGALHPFTEGADIISDEASSPSSCPATAPVIGGWSSPTTGTASISWSPMPLVSDAIRRNMPPPRLTSGLLGHAGRVEQTLARLHAL